MSVCKYLHVAQPSSVSSKAAEPENVKTKITTAINFLSYVAPVCQEERPQKTDLEIKKVKIADRVSEAKLEYAKLQRRHIHNKLT